MKTLNVVVADGVLEMTPKQRGELLKLVQEMGDIDINSSEVSCIGVVRVSVVRLSG